MLKARKGIILSLGRIRGKYRVCTEYSVKTGIKKREMQWPMIRRLN